HHSGRGGGNRRTGDIVDSAAITDLAKNTVHTRVMADDDIIIDGSDTRPSHCAYDNVIARGFAALERLITDRCVVVSGGIGNERFPTSGRVGAAGGIVHERKVTSGRVGGTAVVKDQRVGSKAGILCATGVEQERCRANCSIGIPVVERQRSTANAGVEAAGGIQKEGTPTKPCISSASSKKTKRVAPFHCREVGVARVRCRRRSRRWRGCWRRRWSR